MTTDVNGWSTYETWLVHLWLTQEQARWCVIRALAEASARDAANCDQVRSGVWTADEACTYLLADALKALVEAGNPLADQPSMYADLLTAVMEDVQWQDLAEDIVSEVVPPQTSIEKGQNMTVDPKDGRCRTCGGTLTIVDVDDATMTVECECGNSYQVETDAFGDGCMTYYPAFMMKQMEGGHEDDT